MEFVPAPGVAQCELRFLMDGQRVENIVYFDLGTDPAPVLFNELAQELWDWWAAEMRPLLAPQISLQEVFITDLTSATSETYTYVGGSGPIAGTAAGAALPSNVAACISFRTGGRGRSSRGRNYVAGLIEADVTMNTVDPTTAAALVTAYSELLGAPAITDGVWSVVSRVSGGVPRETALVQPITAAIMTDRTVDSQRRRLPGRGA